MRVAQSPVPRPPSQFQGGVKASATAGTFPEMACHCHTLYSLVSTPVPAVVSGGDSTFLKERYHYLSNFWQSSNVLFTFSPMANSLGPRFAYLSASHVVRQLFSLMLSITTRLQTEKKVAVYLMFLQTISYVN
jgi:hypothetical protein